MDNFGSCPDNSPPVYVTHRNMCRVDFRPLQKHTHFPQIMIFTTQIDSRGSKIDIIPLLEHYFIIFCTQGGPGNRPPWTYLGPIFGRSQKYPLEYFNPFISCPGWGKTLILALFSDSPYSKMGWVKNYDRGVNFHEFYEVFRVKLIIFSKF